MPSRNRAAAHEALIRKYFAACNKADFQDLVSCFTPEAVHYFPPGLPEVPWRGAETIARKWIWCVETLGSRWTIERILCAPDCHEAVVEWTHWKTKSDRRLRGDEWYIFEEESGLITEIRAYYAAPLGANVVAGELAGFDYEGRGYHLEPPKQG